MRREVNNRADMDVGIGVSVKVASLEFKGWGERIGGKYMGIISLKIEL